MSKVRLGVASQHEIFTATFKVFSGCYDRARYDLCYVQREWMHGLVTW